MGRFSSLGQIIQAPASPATRHMAQWESARLEAEARLSRECLLFNPPAPVRTHPDYFLCIRNSEVGESFRKLGRKTTRLHAMPPPFLRHLHVQKCGSGGSGTTAGLGGVDLGRSLTPVSNENEEMEYKSSRSSNEDLVGRGGSDSSSSDELDTALQLLLDFPMKNDMSFLEANIDDYTRESSPLLTDNPTI